MDVIWHAFSAVVELYLAVFFALTVHVWVSGGVGRDGFDRDPELMLAVLTRLLMALFWPVALFSGDLWRCVIRNNFEPRKGEDS